MYLSWVWLSALQYVLKHFFLPEGQILENNKQAKNIIKIKKKYFFFLKTNQQNNNNV